MSNRRNKLNWLNVYAVVYMVFLYSPVVLLPIFAFNSSTIIANQFITRVSEDLIKLYISKGVSQNSTGEYEEARYCFEQATKVCQMLGKFNHDYIIKHGLI